MREDTTEETSDPFDLLAPIAPRRSMKTTDECTQTTTTVDSAPVKTDGITMQKSASLTRGEDGRHDRTTNTMTMDELCARVRALESIAREGFAACEERIEKLTRAVETLASVAALKERNDEERRDGRRRGGWQSEIHGEEYGGGSTSDEYRAEDEVEGEDEDGDESEETTDEFYQEGYEPVPEPPTRGRRSPPPPHHRDHHRRHEHRPPPPPHHGRGPPPHHQRSPPPHGHGPPPPHGHGPPPPHGHGPPPPPHGHGPPPPPHGHRPPPPGHGYPPPPPYRERDMPPPPGPPLSGPPPSGPPSPYSPSTYDYAQPDSPQMSTPPPAMSPTATTNAVPLEHMIADFANMGFTRGQVLNVVGGMSQRGENIDVNTVLDRLMHAST